MNKISKHSAEFYATMAKQLQKELGISIAHLKQHKWFNELLASEYSYLFWD